MKCQRPVVAAVAPRPGQDRQTLAHEPTIPEPRTPKHIGNKVKPTSPFHQAVLQEESFKKAKAQMDRTMQNQGKRVEVLQQILNDPTTADHHKLLLVGEQAHGELRVRG